MKNDQIECHPPHIPGYSSQPKINIEDVGVCIASERIKSIEKCSSGWEGRVYDKYVSLIHESRDSKRILGLPTSLDQRPSEMCDQSLTGETLIIGCAYSRSKSSPHLSFPEAPTDLPVLFF